MPAPSSAPSASRSLLCFILPLAVVAVTFLAFLPVLDAGFLSWDDDVNLVENGSYRGLGWAQIRWMFTTTLMGHYIPLTWLTFGLDYALWGMNPLGYHLTNMLLHAANVALFYAVALRLLAKATSFTGPILRVAGVMAALSFGLHPMRAESVAWATERRDVLSGLFFLLTVLTYLKAAEAEGRRRRYLRVASLACYVAALLSKSIVMTLPFVLVVLDLYPLGRLRWRWAVWRDASTRAVVREKLPYLVLGLAGAAMSLYAVSANHFLTSVETYRWPARMAMTAYSLCFYLEKTVLPIGLSPMYELPAVVNPLEARFLLSSLAVVGLTVVLLALRRRWPAGLAVWACYAIMLGPVTGIVHAGVQLVNDRYSYLSGLGFAVLAGGALAWLLRERERLKPLVVAAGALAAALVLVGWAAGSWRQSKIWQDSETLWRYALDVDPGCAACSINLGAELVAVPSQDPRRAREAEGLFRRALALRPDRVFAYHGLGVALAFQHRDDEAEAAFSEYMKRDPASATGPADLGLLRLTQRRYAEAIPYLRRALAVEPRSPRLRSDLAKALRERGAELQGEGRGLEAEALFAEARTLLVEPARGAAAANQGSLTTTLE